MAQLSSSMSYPIFNRRICSPSHLEPITLLPTWILQVLNKFLLNLPQTCNVYPKGDSFYHIRTLMITWLVYIHHFSVQTQLNLTVDNFFSSTLSQVIKPSSFLISPWLQLKCGFRRVVGVEPHLYHSCRSPYSYCNNSLYYYSNIFISQLLVSGSLSCT